MDIVIDFVLYMIASIKGEEIDKSDLPKSGKVIKKIILFSLLIISAITLYVISDRLF